MYWENQPELPTDKGSNRSRGATRDIGRGPNPENYRPITLLSCIGKLFTAILNKRLTDFIESNSLMNCNQAGVCKKHSTVDNIFVLHVLYNINGKILTVVKTYNNIKLCIYIYGEHSDYFQCHQGVRQGEKLSPIMFSLYLNDLENYLLMMHLALKLMIMILMCI